MSFFKWSLTSNGNCWWWLFQRVFEHEICWLWATRVSPLHRWHHCFWVVEMYPSFIRSNNTVSIFFKPRTDRTRTWFRSTFWHLKIHSFFTCLYRRELYNGRDYMEYSGSQIFSSIRWTDKIVSWIALNFLGLTQKLVFSSGVHLQWKIFFYSLNLSFTVSYEGYC